MYPYNAVGKVSPRFLERSLCSDPTFGSWRVFGPPQSPSFPFCIASAPSFDLAVRYRGVAVRVEDRDQVYSFVDVRDVVVLDPGVACHVGCLVRRGVDALQQGWEFSVQCEQCSKWYHGLCVGFRQEWQVPDLWFCRPCRGESYQIVLNPDAITEPAAIVDRGRASPGGSRSENRGQDGGDSREGTLDVPPSLSAQGGSGEVASGGTQGHEVRNAVSSAPGIDTTALERLQETDSTSYAGVPSAGVAETQQPPVSAATPALGAPVQSPSSSLTPVETAPGGSYTSSSNLPPLERMGTSLDARQQEPAASPPASSPAESTSNLSGAPHQARAMPSPSNASPTPPTPAAANSAPFVFPQVAVPRVRGRGRPRGSRKKTTGSQPSQAPRQTSANPTMTAPPRPGAGAPARPRGRPRGSKNKPKPPAPAQPTAGPPVPTIPAPQPERRSPSPTPAESPASPPRGQRQQRPQQEQAGDGEETPVEGEAGCRALGTRHVSVPKTIAHQPCRSDPSRACVEDGTRMSREVRSICFTAAPGLRAPCFLSDRR